MSPTNGSGSVYPQIREEAAQWFVAFCEEEVDPRACQQFIDWLRRSPQHVRAYLRISAFWEDAEDLKKHARHGIDEIVQRALAEGNVVALGEGGGGPPPNKRVSDRRGWRHALSATLAASCACVGLLMWLLINRESVYSTPPGEQRTLTLTDGSTVELNARSRIRINYSATVRDVELVQGQALFRVAKSPSRPFIVHSDGTSVRAVGTQFDVNQSQGATIVTVVEGRVAVTDGRVPDMTHSPESPASGDAIPRMSSNRRAEVFVAAGERVIARGHTLDAPEPVNTAAATAWTEGKLVFDSVPLKEVLEEFNRYLPRPLIVEDPQLLNMHISGVFSVTESPQFIEFLHQRFGTTSHETNGEVQIARP
jgi:transmembrane sensor